MKKKNRKQDKLCGYKDCDVCKQEGEQRTYYLLGEMVSLLLQYKKEVLEDSRGRHALRHIANRLNSQMICAAVAQRLREKGLLND